MFIIMPPSVADTTDNRGVTRPRHWPCLFASLPFFSLLVASHFLSLPLVCLLPLITIVYHLPLPLLLASNLLTLPPITSHYLSLPLIASDCRLSSSPTLCWHLGMFLSVKSLSASISPLLLYRLLSLLILCYLDIGFRVKLSESPFPNTPGNICCQYSVEDCGAPQMFLENALNDPKMCFFSNADWIRKSILCWLVGIVTPQICATLFD